MVLGAKIGKKKHFRKFYAGKIIRVFCTLDTPKALRFNKM